MKIWSLTFEKAEALRAELAEKSQELEDLMNTSPNQIWLADLDAIEEALDQRDATFSESAADEYKAMNAGKKKQARISKKASKKKEDKWDSNDDDDDDDKMDLSSEDDDVVVKKPSAKRKPMTIKAAAKPVPKPVVVHKAMDVENEIVVASESEKEDDVEITGLADRIKKRLSTSSISPKSLSGDSLDSQLVHASVSPVKSSAAPKAKVAETKKKAAAAKPAAKTTVAKKPIRAARKAPAKKVTKKHDSEEESEDEFAFHSDSSVSTNIGATAPSVSRPQRGRVATAKAKSYNFDMSDDDDDSDF